MRRFISLILIGTSLSLTHFSQAGPENCDVFTQRFVQILVDGGLMNPNVTPNGNAIKITVESDSEPYSFGRFHISKGRHLRTYEFIPDSDTEADPNTADGCMLKDIVLSFKPMGEDTVEDTFLSKEECAQLAETYNAEMKQMNDLHSQERISYLPNVDLPTERFGDLCDQVFHALLYPPYG